MFKLDEIYVNLIWSYYLRRDGNRYVTDGGGEGNRTVGTHGRGNNRPRSNSRGSISSSYFENCYAEIPNEGYNKDLKSNPDYMKKSGQYNPSTASTRSPDSGIVLSTGAGRALPNPDMRNGPRSIDEFDMFQIQRFKSKRKKYVVLHILVMALAGIVYLGIGVACGFYFGKSQCDDCGTLVAAVPPKTTTPKPEQEEYTVSDDITTMLPSATTEPVNSTTWNVGLPLIPCYLTSDGYCACGPFGGDNGKEFSDKEKHAKSGNISGFTVRHNDYFIGSIQFVYGGSPGVEHGYTTSGYQVEVPLYRDEYIETVDMDFTLGKGYLTRIVFHTSLRTLGPYGGLGGAQYTTNGNRLMYIDGKSDSMVDQLTLIYDRCT